MILQWHITQSYVAVSHTRSEPSILRPEAFTLETSHKVVSTVCMAGRLFREAETPSQELRTFLLTCFEFAGDTAISRKASRNHIPA